MNHVGDCNLICDMQSGLIQYLNTITLIPDFDNVQLSNLLNSEEMQLPYVHISKLLDYENDNDEIDELFPNYGDNLNLNMPMQTDLMPRAEAMDQSHVIKVGLENDISIADS